MNVKSQETFKLTSLCHIMIRVEAYRASSGVTSATIAKNLAKLQATTSLLVVHRWLWSWKG